MQNNNNSVIAKKTPVPIRSVWQRLLAVIIIVALLVAGVLVSRHLLKTKPMAKKMPPSQMQTLVKTVNAVPLNANVSIKGFGNVIPAREVNLMARVTGEVKYLHPDFIPGGVVNAGETLVSLDDLDYQIALQQKENAMAKALADLRIEEGNQAIAKKEWELINDFSKDIDPSSADLALRKPQLSMANAAIKVAETDLEKARINLERTEISSPFNAIIRTKNVNLGSQVSNSTTIANLVDIDVFWAILSLPVDKLLWVELPSRQSKGSLVSVSSNLNHRYEGRIVNLLPDLDEGGMMARLLIEINDPMGQKSGNPPLPLGSFIEAEIIGKELKQVFKLPRAALQGENKILTASEDLTLETKEVAVVWKDSEWVYISDGLTANEKIIVSKVSAPLEGMPLEIWREDTPKKDQMKKQQGKRNK